MSEQASAPAAPSAPAEVKQESVAQPSVAQNPAGSQAPSVEDVQDAVESGELSVAEAKSLIKKFQLKIDGKIIDKELDMSDEEAVRNELQLAAVSRKRMEESAQLKKAYQKEMERLKSDPWSVLQELGLDPEEMSVGYISRKVDEMKKSPEQLASEKLQKELEEARLESKKLREEKEEIERKKLQESAFSQINEEIDKAISGHKKLPNTDLVRKKIADTMLWAINQGHEDVTAEDVVPLVEREMKEELNRLYDSMDDDSLSDYIGKKNVDRMRKKRLAASKVPGLSDVKATTASMNKEEPKPAGPKLKAKDLFRQMGRNK